MLLTKIDKLPGSIKSWAESDRPREKLAEKGKEALTDAELLAILIGSGTLNETSVELARRILHQVENNLSALGKLNVSDLKKFKGIGEAKAITIVAAMELCRRRRGSEAIQTSQVKGAKDVVQLFQPQMADLAHEEFWIILLNRFNKVIKKQCISKGGISGTVVDTRL